MAEMKRQTPQAARERSEGVRTPVVQPSISKTAEMVALTTAASGLVLGAMEAARADTIAITNSVFASAFAERLELTDRETTEVQSHATSDASHPVVQSHEASSSGADDVIDVHRIEGGSAAHPSQSRKVDPAGVEDTAPEQAAPIPTDAAVIRPALHEHLVEGIATQISSGVDRIVDQIATGTVAPDFARDMATEIVANVKTLLDDVLPDVTSLMSSIKSDVAEATSNITASVGDARGEVAIEPDKMLDMLTGRVAEITGNSSQLADQLASSASDLASLPASILGGTGGSSGILGEIFYDDGQSASNSATEDLGPTLAGITDAMPLDLGYLGQADFDIGMPAGFQSGTSALHLA